ncbi:MAG TPA: FecR domain-containing protein [Nevskiaceae bacterium]|nr:FecR domain-containing protein [Nevskiaceae bacterium]
MRGEDEIEVRRRALVRALTLGALSGGLGWNATAYASWFGRIPARIAEGKSIFDFSGDVTVNGSPVTSNTLIHAGDTIVTAENSHVVLVVGDTALTLRAKSRLETAGRDFLVNALRMVSGGMLAVFGKRSEALNISTPTATIGIRGTGVYTEVAPGQTYFCTCYGTTQIASSADAGDAVQVTSKHHDAAKYILGDKQGGSRIVPAPFKNHTDVELMTLEALVGRKVPFAAPGLDYDAPRRDYEQ